MKAGLTSGFFIFNAAGTSPVSAGTQRNDHTLVGGTRNNFFQYLVGMVNYSMQIQRKSYCEIDRTYFFTATIHQIKL